MRKFTSLFSVLVLLSLVLAACAPAANNTNLTATESPAATEAVGSDGLATEAVATEAVATEVVVTEAVATEAVATEAVATETVVATEAVATEPVPATEAVATETVAATEAVTGTASGGDVLPSTGQEGLQAASRLMSQEVRAANNTPYGQIVDLAINLSTQHVDYVILLPEGAEENTDQYVPVPWQAFVWAEGSATMTVMTDTLSGANTLDLRAVPALIPSDWDEEFGVYWDETLPAPAAITSTAEVTATESVTETAPRMEGIVLASNLIGKELQTPAGDTAGQLQDFVIDLSSGDVLSVLVSAGEGSQGFIPVPLDVLSRTAGVYSVPVDLSLLQAIPGIDLEALAGQTAEEWQNSLLSFWQPYLP